MHLTNTSRSLVAGFVALTLVACVDQKAVDEVKGRVDLVSAKVGTLQTQQQDILAKLDSLQKGQKDILAKAGTAKPARPQEDPNKVYNLPVGSSFPKGAESPTVTLVEFSDFQ